MWITKISIRQPVFATMVMVALMVLGLASYAGLGVESMPNVSLPFAAIEVQYPGASPEAVENDITRPIEDIVNTVSGVKSIRANSWEGKSGVYLEFDLTTNMDRAMQDVRDKIALVRPRFPREAKDPLIVRAEGENDQAIVQLTITSDTRSLRELSTMTDQILAKRFQGVPGVGQVRVFGTTKRQLQVSLKPNEMTAQGVGVDEIIKAIQDANANLPAGRITHDVSEDLVRVEGKLKEASEFNKIIVARRANGPVYLEQVADVFDGEAEPDSIARVNGKRAISLQVTKVQDANVVEVGRGVIKVAQEMQKTLPPDIKVHVVDSQSDRVQSQVDNVKETIIEGAVLTMIIVFFFLHSWRSTIITGLTLPISVLASFIAMKAFGFTLNFLTLMALSLCIGLLIDDAIVVRENIVRHLGFGKHHRKAAEDGTNEIGIAVMATTFAIVAVFVPVAFMKGLIGRFFLQFGVTVAVSVLVSLFVSFTLDPMLSSVWHDPVKNRFKYVPWLGRFMEGIEHQVEKLHVLYGKILGVALNWRKTTLALAFALFAGSLLLVPKIGGEMFPETDQGWVNLVFKVPVGSSLEYNSAKVAQIEEILKKEYPEIDTMLSNVVTWQGRHTSEVNLKLVDKNKHHRRSQQELEKSIRARLASVAGITMSSGNKPIFIAILGTDEAKLDAAARELMDKMRKIKGIADLEYSQEGASPSTMVKINNELA
ncbi:efflux RND transporter permease subunit, partial [Pseudoduganella sp. RAF53_2]